jgi:hypothetical protein
MGGWTEVVYPGLRLTADPIKLALHLSYGCLIGPPVLCEEFEDFVIKIR